MTNENVNIGGRLYTINREVQPHSTLYPYMQEENEVFAKVSRTAKDVSHRLPELYYGISDITTLKTTLEGKLKQAHDVFKNDAEIDVLVMIALNNGIPFNISGDLQNAYESLNPKFRQLYSKPSNIEIRGALKGLIYNGLVVEASLDNYPFLVGSSDVDPYLNSSKPHNHSLREILHFAGHHAK